MKTRPVNRYVRIASIILAWIGIQALDKITMFKWYISKSDYIIFSIFLACLLFVFIKIPKKRYSYKAVKDLLIMPHKDLAIYVVQFYITYISCNCFFKFLLNAQICNTVWLATGIVGVLIIYKLYKIERWSY